VWSRSSSRQSVRRAYRLARTALESSWIGGAGFSSSSSNPSRRALLHEWPTQAPARRPRPQRRLSGLTVHDQRLPAPALPVAADCLSGHRSDARRRARVPS
jgi:hypothetical protein